MRSGRNGMPAPGQPPPARPQPPAPAYAALASMPLLFGLSFAATKFALRGFQPLQLAMLRFVLAGAVMGLAWRLRPGRERISRADLRRMALLGFISLTVYFSFETTGIARTSASAASILIATIPIFVSVLSAAVLKERNSGGQWAGVTVSFGGVVALVVLGGGHGGVSLLGNLLVLCAALSAAVYQILARRFLLERSALYLTAFMNLFGALFMAPLAVLEAALLGVRQPTPAAGLGLAYLVVFCSMAGYLLLNFGLRHVEASRASTFVNLTPVVAVAGAFVLLGERFTLWQGLAAGVVIVGVWLANRRGVAARSVGIVEG